MRVIVNADDFGSSVETVAATIGCFERGALTSATIMPNMPATAEATAFARAHPEFSFGVHLVLVGDGEERPAAGAEHVPALADTDGRFPRRTNDVRLRALLGRLPLDQLERELTAQIESVRAAGVEVSHVDSHRHLHKLGRVRVALGNVLPRLGIRRVRRVQDVYLRTPLASPTYWLGPWWQRRLGRLGAGTTTHFYMPWGSDDGSWEEPLLQRMARLSGSLEVGVHPGARNEGAAAERFAAGARDAGHELVPWTSVGEPS